MSTMEEAPVADRDIIEAVKMLEGIESSTTVEDINTYKTNTRNLFEQLLLKLEENSDHIYSLEHRVKFLEQECEDKDLDIEKMTMSMQEAVNDCRQEAEEMVGELMGKVSVEVNQRHEIEGLVRRLQSDNAKLKDYAALQKVPGWDKSLHSIIEETTRKETRVYQAECESLRASCEEWEEKWNSLQLQREAEMNATVSVIKFTQQKIETLHLQLKFHQKKEQQEHQQKGNRKKGKKSSSNNSFNTPQKDAPTPEGDSSSSPTQPAGSGATPSPSSSSPPVSKSKKNTHGNEKALHNKRNSRGKKGGGGGGGGNKQGGANSANRRTSSASDNQDDGSSDQKLSSSSSPAPPTSPVQLDQEKEGNVTPEVLIQKSKSFWGMLKF